MPQSPLATFLWAGLILLSACVMPADESGEVTVSIDAPSTLLLQGRTMLLRAHAWRQDDAGNLTELAGMDFDWNSSRLDLAQVDPRDDGTALVTPVNGGVVRIEAAAAGLASSDPGAVQLRIANTLVIDSVRPATAHYGEQLTVFGVGLGELSRLSLGEADLIPDPSTFLGDGQGLGQQSFWVPYPAGSDRALAISRRGITTAAPETTQVRQADLYHELSAPPPQIDLAGPAVRGPDTLFHNPAFAVVDGEGTDLLQFHRAGGLRSLTFTFSSQAPFVTGFDPILTGDPAPPPVPPTEAGIDTWSVGLSGQYCHGGFVELGRPVPASAPVTLVRALKDVSATDMLAVIEGAPPGRYSVTVRDGYQVADPAIGPDSQEENDYCAAADAHPVTLPFADVLSIDNPYDVDWLRFEIPDNPEGLGVRVAFRVAARPLGASDSSNIGLLLAGERGSVRDSARTAGSTESIGTLLSPGAYYLLVTDEAGVSTRYAVCMAEGTSCSFPDEGGGEPSPVSSEANRGSPAGRGSTAGE
jgi:hypothetical protein